MLVYLFKYSSKTAKKTRHRTDNEMTGILLWCWKQSREMNRSTEKAWVLWLTDGWGLSYSISAHSDKSGLWLCFPKNRVLPLLIRCGKNSTCFVLFSSLIFFLFTEKNLNWKIWNFISILGKLSLKNNRVYKDEYIRVCHCYINFIYYVLFMDYFIQLSCIFSIHHMQKTWLVLCLTTISI